MTIVPGGMGVNMGHVRFLRRRLCGVIAGKVSSAVGGQIANGGASGERY